MKRAALLVLLGTSFGLPVIVASANGGPDGERRSSGGYRLVGTPIAESFDGGRAYSVYFRTDRSLPRIRNDEGNRRIGATVLVAGGGSRPSPSVSGRRSRRCYNADVEFLPREAIGLPIGSQVRIAVRISGVRFALRAKAKVIRPEADAFRRLGC